MAQGPELSELQRRVEAARARFCEVTDDCRRHGERLTGLLDQVEGGVVQGHQEIERLTQALAEAQEENAQLRDLLQSVVALAEQLEAPAGTKDLIELETRMERLSTEAAAPNGADGQRNEPLPWEPDAKPDAAA